MPKYSLNLRWDECGRVIFMYMSFSSCTAVYILTFAHSFLCQFSVLNIIIDAGDTKSHGPLHKIMN